MSIIDPSRTQNSQIRVISQSNVFVHAPKGYVDQYETYTIKATDKPLLLKFLKQVHNIKIETIYNDIIDFVSNEENYKDAKSEFAKGSSSFNQSQYTDAITYFSKAIELDPNYAQAYLRRSMVKAHIKEYTKAIKDFDKAI